MAAMAIAAVCAQVHVAMALNEIDNLHPLNEIDNLHLHNNNTNKATPVIVKLPTPVVCTGMMGKVCEVFRHLFWFYNTLLH